MIKRISLLILFLSIFAISFGVGIKITQALTTSFYFIANGSVGPITVNSGDPVAITWGVSGTGWTVDCGIPSVYPSISGQSPSASNSQTFNPTQSTIFKLSCSRSDLGGGPNLIKTVTANVSGKTKFPDVNVTVDGVSDYVGINEGEDVTVSWNSSDAAKCAITGLPTSNWSNPIALSGSKTFPFTGNSASIGVACVNSDTLTVFPNPNENTAGASIDTVVVVPFHPSVDMKVNGVHSGNGTPIAPIISVNSGDFVSLAWQSTNAIPGNSSCTASAIPTSAASGWTNAGWTGTKPVSGSFTTGPLIANTRFDINCLNNGVVGFSNQVFVNVIPPPVLPTVTVTAPDPNASETGPATGTYTITRTGATTASLTVLFTMSSDSATNGTDYTTITSPITIPAGSASVSKTLTPIDDSLVEGAETAILTIATDAAYTIGSPSSATITIADNDVAAVPPPVLSGSTSASCGGKVDLFWTSSAGATRYDVYNAGNVVYSGADLSATVTMVAPSTSYNFAVFAYNGNVQSASSNTITVTSSVACSGPLPTVDIKANNSDGPLLVPYDTAATLSWTSTNATTCTASGGWSGSKAVSGSGVSTGNITTTKTFTITCVNATGQTANDSVTINARLYPPSNLSTYTRACEATPKTGMTWTAVTGATKYFVYRATSLNGNYTNVTIPFTGFLQTTNPDYTDSNGLTAGVSYYYKVTSYNTYGGESAQSLSSGPVIASSPCIPPTVDLKANGSDGPIFIMLGNGVTLSYVFANATSCAITESTMGLNSLIEPDGTGAGIGTSPTGPLNSSKTFILTCTGEGGTSSSDSVTINVVTPPTLSGSTSQSCGNKVDLSWTAVTGASRYDVYNAGNIVYSGANLSAIVAMAAPNTNYNFAVFAYDSSGTLFAMSNTISVTSSAICPAAPVQPAPVAMAGLSCGGLVGFTWNAVPNATSYRVYDYTGSNLLETVIPPNSLQYTQAGLTPGNFYGYYLSAYNSLSGLESIKARIDLTATDACLNSQTVTVTATDSNANETGPATGTYTITRTGDNTNPLTVLFTMSGTATNGTDYTTITSPITIPAGSASVSKTLTPIDDSINEGSETAIMTLVTDAAYLVGTPSSATITISDNDAPPVQPTPTPITNLSCGGLVGFTWNAVPNATSYRVYDYTGSNLLETIVAGAPLLYVNTLTPNTIYGYYVTAYNSILGLESIKARIDLTSTGECNTLLPSDPNPIAMTGLSCGGTIGFTWSAVSGNPIGYKVYNFDQSQVLYSVPSGGVLQYSQSGLTSGNTYGYYVSAYNAIAESNRVHISVTATTQCPGDPGTGGGWSLSATCSASPLIPEPVIGTLITWTAYPSGGKPPYTYLWSGAVSGTNNPATPLAYSSSGTKNVSVVISDLVGNHGTANCSVPISSNPTGAGMLEVSCNSTPSGVDYYVNEPMTWTASVLSGGTGPYTYSWSGTNNLSGTTQSLTKTYSTIGFKTAVVNVSDNNSSAVGSCTLDVRIKVNPNPIEV